MITYFIERGGAVVAQGVCEEDQLDSVDRMGGRLVLETSLPKASPPADFTALIKRRELLEASDWTQLPDVPLETKALWATYRQALRDITDQPGYPTNISWPEPPTT